MCTCFSTSPHKLITLFQNLEGHVVAEHDEVALLLQAFILGNDMATQKNETFVMSAAPAQYPAGFVHGECGYEKSCTMRNFPGFPGLGRRERGDDWKGPMRDSSSVLEKGPMYLPFLNSFSTISS